MRRPGGKPRRTRQAEEGHKVTDTERAAAIRKELKGLGITSKQVGVRCTRGGSIRCTIKDLAVSEALVKKIASKYEVAHWDDYAGEYLEGGNTFVFVDYDYGSLHEAAAGYRAKAEEILSAPRKGDCTLLAQSGGQRLYYQPDMGRGELWLEGGKDRRQRFAAHCVQALAESLAILKYQRGIVV
jgi:hypothetical protein